MSIENTLTYIDDKLNLCVANLSTTNGGWLGEAKVLYILHHWGGQLILAYSWARPAILAAGKGGGAMFLFLFLHFTFIRFPLSPLSLSFISSTTISLRPFSWR